MNDHVTPVTGWDFWRFSFRLGLRESVRGLDYFRFYEYPTFYESLGIEAGDRVLDLGCGRGLFPLFCADRRGDVEYTTLDIDPGAVDWQTAMAQKLGGAKNLNPCLGDSTNLEFEDGSFDRVANLGSIEHIPEEGDISTAGEMGRVCRPGGRLVFSIPYSFVGCVNATTDHWDGFERRYDDKMLEERLIEPSGCEVVSVTYFGEPGFAFSETWYPLPFVLKLPFRHFMPIASTLWLKEIPKEKREAACGVRLVLRKPA